MNMNKKNWLSILMVAAVVFMVGAGLVLNSRNNLGISPAHAANDIAGTNSYSEELNLSANLFLGSRGQNVSKLQNFLQAQGVYSGPVTGYFGPLTKRAVVEFQKQNKINPASGFVGPLTRAFIFRMTTRSQNVYPSVSPSANPAQYQYQPPSGSSSPSSFLPPYSYSSSSPSLGVTNQVYIATTYFPDGVVNQPYAAMLQAIGGSGSYHWSLISGTLPSGLILQNNVPCTDSNICPMVMIRPSLSGTPSIAGKYSFTLQVTDSNDNSNAASQSYTININNIPSPTVTPLPSPTTTPLSNPTTTPLSSPTTTPSAGVSATVSIDNPPYVTVINWPNSITQTVTGTEMPFLPYAIVNQPYKITLSGMHLGLGGFFPSPGCSLVGPYALPLQNAGFSFTQSGVLSGVPQKVGDIPFSFGCYSGGSAGTSVSFVLDIKVVGSLEDTLTTVSSSGSPYYSYVHTDASHGFDDFMKGVYDTATLHAVGGTGNYTWSLVQPSRGRLSGLPPGLSLSSDGVISGTPTKADQIVAGIPYPLAFSFDVQVSDGVSSRQNIYQMKVDPLNVVITQWDNQGFPLAVCSRLSYPLGDTEIGTNDRFSLTGGKLPPGVSIRRFLEGPEQGLMACYADNSQVPCTKYDNEIFGWPTAPGQYNFSITRSSDGGTVQYQLGVLDDPGWAPYYDCGASLSIETKTLPPATVGVPYFAVIQLADANGQFQFEAMGLNNFPPSNFPSGLTVSKINPNTGKRDPNQLYIYGTPGIPSAMRSAPAYPYTGGSMTLWVESSIMGGVGKSATLPIVLNGPAT